MRIDTKKISWDEFAAYAEKGAPAIMAVGAQEQHGPHCGLATDTIMSEALTLRIADEIGALVLPALPYGECYSTSAYPGTISLQPETLAAVALDIGRSVKKHGVRALIFVNGHFGNSLPLNRTARELIDEGLSVLVLDYPELEQIASKYCESKPVRPGFFHADEVETSIVLAVNPEAVRMEKAQPCYPIFPKDYDENPGLLSEFNPSGVFGDPTFATAEKGILMLDALTESAVKVVRDFLEGIA